MSLIPPAATTDRATTLAWFFDVLDAHADRIERTKRKVDSVYAFRTPETPYFEYTVTDVNTSVVTPFVYSPSPWAETIFDRRLDGALQRIAWNLEAFPQNDYVPSIHPGHGTSDLIPGLYGCEFDLTPEGAVINRNYRILDLARDIDGFLSEEIDLAAHPIVRDQIEYARFASEAVEGRVQVVYPQMQGPLTNAMRIMEQTEMLMACVSDRRNLSMLAMRIAEHISDITLLLIRAVGDRSLLRPRSRFYQPPGVLGLIVDDYISVVGPERYFEICEPAWRTIAERLGNIYLHTCGPVEQRLEMMCRLPGLVALETAFVSGQHATTEDISRTKRRLDGRLVFGTFGLPHGEPVEDPEHLTRRWLEEVSTDGGFMMHASGSYETGAALFTRLGIG